MLFNSYIFIFLMLPLTLILYFLLNRIRAPRLALLSLLGMSLWFYGYFNPSYLLILCSSILVNWILSRLILHKKPKKLLLTLGLVFNVGLIFYFKYFDFFIQNINSVFGSDIALFNILLPLGISFFTFQQISYMIDTYHGKTAKYNFLEYATFVAYFPQLVAGPIVLHDELIPQFSDKTKKTFNFDNFAKGLYMLSIGLFKKVIVADTLANIVNPVWEYDVSDITSPVVWVAAIAYTFQIYYDFSGYSDMAIGIGNMFNLTLPINFNSPYKACSIGEFWNRWHITLSRFLRQYIYFPLGGSKKGAIRTYINLFLVFLISGIWHGANWTFIVWGLLHGIASIVQRLFKKTKIVLPKLLNWALTFYFVNLAWIFFRADTMEKAFLFVEKLVFIDGFSFGDTFFSQQVAGRISIFMGVANSLGISPGIVGIAFFAAVFTAITIATVKLKNIHEKTFKPSVFNILLTTFCMLICIVSFSKLSTFLYFNF